MKTFHEILLQVIEDDEIQLLLADATYTRKHNGIEYEMVRTELVLKAHEIFAAQSKERVVEKISFEEFNRKYYPYWKKGVTNGDDFMIKTEVQNAYDFYIRTFESGYIGTPVVDRDKLIDIIEKIKINNVRIGYEMCISTVDTIISSGIFKSVPELSDSEIEKTFPTDNFDSGEDDNTEELNHCNELRKEGAIWVRNFIRSQGGKQHKTE